MSYYIKPYIEPKKDRVTMFRVVKRLRDFRPEEGVEYMVFRSKKAIRRSLFIDLYHGKNGKLVKMKYKSLLRFI